MPLLSEIIDSLTWQDALMLKDRISFSTLYSIAVSQRITASIESICTARIINPPSAEKIAEHGT